MNEKECDACEVRVRVRVRMRACACACACVRAVFMRTVANVTLKTKGLIKYKARMSISAHVLSSVFLKANARTGGCTA